MLAGRSDRAGGAMVPGLHVAVRLLDIAACWAGADGSQERHVMEINLLCTGTLPSSRGGWGGGLNSECVRTYEYAVMTIDMDSPPVVVVVTTVLGSWVERATILTVYASLVLPVMVCSEVLAPSTVALPVSAPPLVAS